MGTIKRPANKSFKLRLITAAAACCAAVLSLVLLYNISPYENHVTICPFYYFTGLQCPGCGMTRALYNLLHLNLKQAFLENAFVYALPLIAYMALSELLPRLFPSLRLPMPRVPIWLLWVFIAAWLIYGLGRNIFLFI